MEEPRQPVEKPGETVPGGDRGEERDREQTPPPPEPEEARGEDEAESDD
jgi:hypothetical protein